MQPQRFNHVLALVPLLFSGIAAAQAGIPTTAQMCIFTVSNWAGWSTNLTCDGVSVADQSNTGPEKLADNLKTVIAAGFTLLNCSYQADNTDALIPQSHTCYLTRLPKP